MSLCSGLVGRKKNGPRHCKTGPPFTSQLHGKLGVGEVLRTCQAELG